MNRPRFVSIRQVRLISASKAASRYGRSSPSEGPLGFLLPAVLAYAVDLKSMPRGLVVVFPPNLLLKLVHFWREEFHRTAALGADHMVMAPPIVLVLIPRNAIVERHDAR